jgi:transcriptional antiterminator RfaH
MSKNTQRNWYLLASKPRKDAVAEFHLRNQEYEVYRPLAKRLHTRRGKMITITESLFPRYLFIHLDSGIDDNWAPIKNTIGIHGFVRFGINNLPPPVPEALVLALQAQEEGLSERSIDLDRFHNGDEVVITEGPFRGLKAIFQQYKGEDRVVILMQLLNARHPSKMEISPAHLYAA